MEQHNFSTVSIVCLLALLFCAVSCVESLPMPNDACPPYKALVAASEKLQSSLDRCTVAYQKWNDEHIDLAIYNVETPEPMPGGAGYRVRHVVRSCYQAECNYASQESVYDCRKDTVCNAPFGCK
jgi:hypothetical protein